MAYYRNRARSNSWDYRDTKPVKATYIPNVGAYKVSFPFVENFTSFIDTLKKLVPSGKREYDHETKEWTIAEEYWDNQVFPLLKIIFHDKEFVIADKATVESFNQGSTLTTEIVSTDVLVEKFFVLLEKAGLKPNRDAKFVSEVKKEYYRATRFYHPDFNPSGANDMSELTYLWSNLKGIYFKEQQNGK